MSKLFGYLSNTGEKILKKAYSYGDDLLEYSTNGFVKNLLTHRGHDKFNFKIGFYLMENP